MIEGVEHDDGFRMMEDELLATAQQFTAHLHAAEYQRLKDVAASQNAKTIRQISRPVVGRTTDEVKRKHERAERRRKQKETRQRLLLNKAAKRKYSDDESSSSGTDDDDAGDLVPPNSSLYGLLASPRKQAPRLDGIPGIALGTRTGAGARAADVRRHDAPLALSFETRPAGRPAAPMLDMDDDSDDLEAPGRHVDAGARSLISGETVRPNKTNPAKHAVSLQPPNATNNITSAAAARQIHPVVTKTFDTSSKAAPARPAHLAETGRLNNQSSNAIPSYKPPIATAEPAEQTESESDDDPFSGIKSRLAQRLGDKRKQQALPNATKPASSSRDCMPSFL